MSRLARLLAGRNALRRPVDRIEGAVLMALSAAFVVAVVIACIFGTHTYQAQRAATASLRPAASLLLQVGPAADGWGPVRLAEARWYLPEGGERSGVLTTATAPGIADASPGDRIPVWLDRSGQPAAPPAGQDIMIIHALIVVAGVAASAGIALLLVYALSRLALDRRRLVAWESAWNRTGPSWTTRR
jgi:hypothetical protein